MIRLAILLTLLTAITAQAWTQEMLMRKAYGARGASAVTEWTPVRYSDTYIWTDFVGMSNAASVGSYTNKAYFASSVGQGTQATEAARASYTNLLGGSLYFDGGNDAISYSLGLGQSNNTGRTYTILVSLTEPWVFRQFINTPSGSNQRHYFGTYAGKVYWAEKTGDFIISKGANLPTNTLTEITFTMGVSLGIAYVNGVAIGTNNTPTLFTYAGNLGISQALAGVGTHYGIVGYFMQWETVLTPAEVAESYNSNKAHYGW
jgi:hypothetical protein